MIGLHLLGKQYGIRAAQVRMDVMQQLGFESHFGAHILKDWRNGLDIQVLVKWLSLVAALGAATFVGRNETAAPVTASVLQANMTEAVLHRSGDYFRGLLLAASADVVITRHCVVCAATQHLIHRHAGALSLDV